MSSVLSSSPSPSLLLLSSWSSVIFTHQNTHTQHSTVSPASLWPVYRGFVCECGGAQRTPSLGWASTENTLYISIKILWFGDGYIIRATWWFPIFLIYWWWKWKIRIIKSGHYFFVFLSASLDPKVLNVWKTKKLNFLVWDCHNNHMALVLLH